MRDLPQAAVAAALHARDESQSMTDEGLARDMLAAAAPFIVADALRSAARERFETAIAEAAEEATTARLHEIEAAVRASERGRLSAVMSPAAFRALADWFDTDDEFKVTMFPATWRERGHDVQDDLRKFADLLEGDHD